MADRPTHYCQPPLAHCKSYAQCIELDDEATRVYSAPGYMVFIERMWHGEYQQVPIDPDHIPELIEALEDARARTREEESANAS